MAGGPPYPGLGENLGTLDRIRPADVYRRPDGFEGLRPPEEEAECADPTRGFSLVMLSVATSIDALGVGFSLGVLNQNLFMVAVCIGITAAAMTWLAMKIGNRLSQRFAKRMEIIGGFILVAIAFKLLLG